MNAMLHTANKKKAVDHIAPKNAMVSAFVVSVGNLLSIRPRGPDFHIALRRSPNDCLRNDFVKVGNDFTSAFVHVYAPKKNALEALKELGK